MLSKYERAKPGRVIIKMRKFEIDLFSILIEKNNHFDSINMGDRKPAKECIPVFATFTLPTKQQDRN